MIVYSEQARAICAKPYTKYAVLDSVSSTGEPIYVSICQEFNGCMSQGDTSEQALEMLEDAMLLWVQCALDDEYPIPEPTSQLLHGADNKAVYYYSIDMSDFYE